MQESRYGFNGKEKDTDGEWGSNTHYDYGFRIYNPAIAKFLSVDPLTKSYPWYTPYQFAGNKPIAFIDLDGLEPARPPLLTGKAHIAITRGKTGVEARLIGTRTGGTVSLGGGDLVGLTTTLDTENGFDANLNVFDFSEEKFGLSGGDVFGGEFSFTFDSENGTLTNEQIVNFGIFYIKRVQINEGGGEKGESLFFLGIEAAVSKGAIIGAEADVSAELFLNDLFGFESEQELEQIEEDNCNENECSQESEKEVKSEINEGVQNE